jgi:hypothetical protein
MNIMNKNFARLALTASLAPIFIGAFSKSALADPVPPPPDNEPYPAVFCFRITDIKGDSTDLNKFTFEFEVLNWTNKVATDVDIALNTGVTSYGLVLNNPGVDQNGSPLGTDGSRPPGNQDIPNNWSVQTSTSTYVRWSKGLADAIPNIDVVGIHNSLGNITASTINYINNNLPDSGSTGYFPNKDFNPSVAETIDNANNVLDGFNITVDDFDNGESLSFNWFLSNGGVPIGTANVGNPYGFGTLNLARVDDGVLPAPVWSGNTGYSQSANLFANGVWNVSNPSAQFAAEFGAGITAPFRNANDSTNICGSGGCAVSVPWETDAPPLIGSTILFGIGLWARSKFSKSSSK